jgi:hypothetical protein
MTEFLMVCVLFSVILLATSGCTRNETKNHDVREYTVEMISTEEECQMKIVLDADVGGSGDDIEITPPSGG